VFAVRDIIVFAVLAGIAAALVLAALPWTRHWARLRGRWVLAGLATTAGFVAWNLRTKDNLEVAPGLFIYQVEAPGIGTSIGKFAIIK